MKRIQEKVKDLIEVRGYKILNDFISDPAQTLAVYHFTDVTSDLMAKWLDKVAAIQGRSGASMALAGYRGVGKSHFLAAIGALLTNSELRSRVPDGHVAASAQRLKRTRYQVGYVRRGTRETLFEELKDAVAKVLAIDAVSLSDSLIDLLNQAAEKSGDTPFVLIIDTAFERSSRVARDDGVLLGEIAEIAKNLNLFVAVALDDDIADADGINAAIARSFSINYLDQEHLYRIVEADVFPKHQQKTPLLHDIYTNFRQLMPNFLWSEQRFVSLYPLHPVILETAPFVRLYAPEFALLGFASIAGDKIMGRPANSLIALDEVFDSVETSLRKVEELKEAFIIFDKFNSGVISQIPVLQRLQAKLVLKALFILSLEGEGATAGEISAAMLIYDENEPLRAVKIVEELLETFVAAFPADINRIAEEGREVRYGLKVSSKDNLNNALNDAAQNVSPAVIPKIFRRVAREKFSDWLFDDRTAASNADCMDCRIVWRGGLRRGRLIWNYENKFSPADNPAESSEFLDWEIIISTSENQNAVGSAGDGAAKVHWQAAPLRKEEIDALLRYYVLQNDNKLREEYGDQIRAAGHAHFLAIEKIWNRVFLLDGKLVIDDFDYKFTDEARSATTLSEMFSVMLEPLFEATYPSHPYFAQALGVTEVSILVKDFFGGARQTSAEAQKLAEIFALPLGLVTKRGDVCVLEREENLINLPLVREVLAMFGSEPDNSVSLKDIYNQLRKTPYGLGREAQHLILTALVAQRQIEFVTSKNDRINRRSLDLTIIWDDVEGIAKPLDVVYSNERLTEWAKILTVSDAFSSIDAPDEQEIVIRTLDNWLADWNNAAVLKRFDQLADETLNTKIWRVSTRIGKSFGSVAETIKALVSNEISIEEGLHRIADTFSDSENEFMSCSKDLVVLEDFIEGSYLREEIRLYLTLGEYTGNAEIESRRAELTAALKRSYDAPGEAANAEVKALWESFHKAFNELYAGRHEAVMKSHHLQEQIDEIIRGDQWWEFENLSRLPIVHQDYWKQAQKILYRIKELNCRFDIRQILRTQPYCMCSFSLARVDEWEILPSALADVISRGRRSYLKTLRTMSDVLIAPIERSAAQFGGEAFSDAAARLIDRIKGAEFPDALTSEQLMILQNAFLAFKTPAEGAFQVNAADRLKTDNEFDFDLTN